jgi:N-acylglucosamine-6-phosphate 2-epimerase
MWKRCGSEFLYPSLAVEAADSGFEVYITPQFCHAETIAQAGADVIAIDATNRLRPEGETLETLIHRIHTELGKPVMADVDTLEAAIAAEKAGADLVGTTLYGYTQERAIANRPDSICWRRWLKLSRFR